MSKKSNIPAGDSDPGKKSGIRRRSFIQILGGGIFIFFQPWNVFGRLAGIPEEPRTLTKDYNGFLLIGEDGMVSCYTGKIEMGQGIVTSLAQMMADELNVPFERVKMVMGDTDLCPYDQGTWGSLSTRSFGVNMRAAAAEARGVLLSLAAERFGVPVSQLEVSNGVITDRTNAANSVSYAQLTKGKKIEKYLDPKP